MNYRRLSWVGALVYRVACMCERPPNQIGRSRQSYHPPTQFWWFWNLGCQSRSGLHVELELKARFYRYPALVAQHCRPPTALIMVEFGTHPSYSSRDEVKSNFLRSQSLDIALEAHDHIHHVKNLASIHSSVGTSGLAALTHCKTDSTVRWHQTRSLPVCMLILVT